MATFARLLRGSMLLVAAACGGTVEPVPDETTASLARERVGCRPTIVVGGEADLRAAVASAPPGAAIGVRGTIVLTSDLVIDRPDLTLTCATRGATLVATGAYPGEFVGNMIDIRASAVRIIALRVDATMAGLAAIVAFGDPALGGPIDGFGVSGTTVLCANGIPCIYAAGIHRAPRIVDNEVISDAAFAGVLLSSAFAPVESPVVERNRITELGLNPGAFSGIRLSSVSGAVVRRNVVTGAWRSSIGLVNVVESTIAGNSLLDPLGWGISQSVGAGTGLRDTEIVENTIRGGNQAGIDLADACYNRLADNRLSGVATEYLLRATTGANSVVTRNGAAVNDLGARDCDGDGVIDPNTIRVSR
ncbi:MAG: right-handed parallel beta-helix repeat-containing protein [Gemmatimonadales bacterium]